MKKQKQSMLIHVWEDYEFYLYIPETISRDSKPFIFYYYQDTQSQRSVRIKKVIKSHKGDKKLIMAEAKKALTDVIALLESNWNPVSNAYNEIEISPLSTIQECITYWLKSRAKSFENKTISAGKLKNDKILMNHFTNYLQKSNLLQKRVSTLTNVNVREFLDTKALERGWNKVSYNTYRIDLGTFFNYLLDLGIVKVNPVKKTAKKSLKHDSSRFKVFETDELRIVAEALAKEKYFKDLHVASKLLFKYNIRPIEITRIQIQDIDWDKTVLTLSTFKTKNGNEARFLLGDDMIVLLKELSKDAPSQYYLFGSRNKPSPTITFADYFGQRWRAFRKKYKVSNHLKLYALKHTSNYYDLQEGASFEEIRQRNRHSNLQVTTLYIKERLFKNVIKGSTSNLF